MENRKVDGRGGVRTGAGRPATGRQQKTVTIVIDADLTELWMNLESKSKTVCELLRKEFADKIK